MQLLGKMAQLDRHGAAPTVGALPVPLWRPATARSGPARSSCNSRITFAQLPSERGNDIGARSYGSIASILQHGLDRACAQEKVADGAPIKHANIRGRSYYH